MDNTEPGGECEESSRFVSSEKTKRSFLASKQSNLSAQK